MPLSQLLCFPCRRPSRGSTSVSDSPNNEASGGRVRDGSNSQLAPASVILNHSNLAPALNPRELFAPPPTHRPTPHPHQLSPQPQDRSSDTHHGIHHDYSVSVEGNNNSVTYMSNLVSGADNFMKELLERTIPGAAFDSSARDPPPRCLPGTRLAILERCIHFINCSDEKKIRWVFGAAGVGKSAIMQNVAESPLASVALRASIFFFVNGRSDGTKAIVTLAYQLAVQCDPYCQFIKHEIEHDPSLFQKSMSMQFNKFIVKPFIHHPQLNSAGRILIIIDGLDECDKSHTQRELLQLISDFCLTYSSSPIVWIIASRPEHHITSFFSRASVAAAYEKEEIFVDSEQGRRDVERFLRIELTKIQHEFSLDPKWLSEPDFWKLANASGGLFVYAHTVVKYISDSDIGDPTLQLREVLKVIDTHPLPDGPREEHPMALLDLLYSRILSKVPAKVRENTRKLLLALVVGWESEFEKEGGNFIVLCNWLGMTYDEAYAALRPLSSVLDVPRRDKAHKRALRYFHKSFIDYITDPARSEFSRDIKREAHELYVRCTFRILEQAPDGIDVGDLDYEVNGEKFLGTLARGPGTGGNISLTWRVDEESRWHDNRTRLFIYKMAIANVVVGIENREQAFCTVFCIRALATRFERFITDFGNWHGIVFDKSRHREFTEGGLLRRIPVKALNFPHILFKVQLQFRCPTTASPNPSGPWNISCRHKREGEWGEGKTQSWSTHFYLYETMPRDHCDFCCKRFERQLENWKAISPDHPVSVLFTSARTGAVEFKFVDPEDGMSEWTYWFWHTFSEKQRKKLGSTV